MSFLDKLLKSIEPDFGKPLPKKEPREGETKFEHKIRQWTDEVKERPGRFPGGQKQAIAIAAQQSGVSKGSEGETEKHKEKMRVFIDEMAEEYAKAGVGSSGIRQAGGTGFSVGQGIGAGLDRPGGAATGVASGVNPTVSAISGSGGNYKPSGGRTAPKAATAPKAPTAPAAPTSPPTSYPTAGMELGPAGRARMSVKSHGCDKCMKGECPHGGEEGHEEIEKALTSRALSIPAHLRQPAAYDFDAIRRSATQQTSRMYTSLSPGAAESILNAAEQENKDPRVKAVKSQEESSKKVQEMRDKIAAAMVPRTGIKFVR